LYSAHLVRVVKEAEFSRVWYDTVTDCKRSRSDFCRGLSLHALFQAISTASTTNKISGMLCLLRQRIMHWKNTPVRTYTNNSFYDLPCLQRRKPLPYVAAAATINLQQRTALLYCQVRDKGLQLKLLSLYVPRRHTGEAEVLLYSFITSSPVGSEWWPPCPGRFTPGKEHRYPLNKRLVGPQRM